MLIPQQLVQRTSCPQYENDEEPKIMTRVIKILYYIVIPILAVIASTFLPIYPKWQPIAAVTIVVLVLASLGLNAFLPSMSVALFCLFAPIAFFAIGIFSTGQSSDLISAFVSQYVARWPEMLDFVVGPFLPILVYVVTKRTLLRQKTGKQQENRGQTTIKE